jgi:hypothetical protein
MKPKDFQKKYLGFGSSHPDGLTHTARIYSLIAAVPLLLVLLTAFILLIDKPSLVLSVDGIKGWMVVLMYTVVIAAAAAATLGLAAGLGHHKAKNKGRYADAPDNVGRSFIIMGTLFGIVFPLVGANIDGLPNSVKLGCRLTLVLPMLLLFVYLGRSRADGEDKVKRRRPILAILLLPVGALLAYSVFEGMLRSLGSTDTFLALDEALPFLSGALDGISRWAILVPLFFVIQSAYRLWPGWLDQKQAEERERKVSGGGIFKKTWRWFLRLIGWLPAEEMEGIADDEEREEEETDPVPTWLDQVLKRLPANCVRPPLPEIYYPQGGNSPILENCPELETFFSGFAPTSDQEEVFSRFNQTYDELIAAAGENAVEFPPGDLLIEGAPGSGRTTTLMACAASALITRGQGSLFLVPDSISKKPTIARLRAAFIHMGLEDYVLVKGLDTRIGLWIEDFSNLEEKLKRLRDSSVQNEDREEEIAEVEQELEEMRADPKYLPPDVLVATPSDVERFAFGFDTSNSDRLDQLREFLDHYEVVLVDDISKTTGSARAHLPFLLDKLRLIHAADDSPMQIVAVTDPVPESVVPILGERLFGLRRFPRADRQRFFMKPRATKEEALFMPITCPDPHAAIRSVVRAALDNGLKTLVYHRGMATHSVEAERASLARTSERAKNLTVVGNLDELALMQSDPFHIALYTESLHTSDLLSLSANLEGRKVILAFRQLGNPEAQYREETVPLFPGRDSERLSSAHIQSAIRLLPTRKPIPMSGWRDLGLDPDLVPVKDVEGSPSFGWWIDGHEELETIEDMAVIEGHTLDAHPVDSRRMLPARGISIVEERVDQPKGAKDRLMRAVTSAPSPEAEQSVALWKDSQGNEIGSTELPHAGKLRHSEEENPLVPSHFDLDGDKLEINAEPSMGTEQDFDVPIVEFDFELPKDLKLNIHHGGADLGLSWGSLSIEEGAPIVTARLHGRSNAHGKQTEDTNKFEFSYPVHPEVLFLGPKKMEPEERAERYRKAVCGSWSADVEDQRFLPALTTGLNFSFNQHMSGFPHFCRVAAFALEGEDRPADVVVFLLEPVATGKATLTALGRCLKDQRAKRGLLGTALWVVESLEEADDACRLCRSFSLPAIHLPEGTDLRTGESKSALRTAGAPKTDSTAQQGDWWIIPPDHREYTVDPEEAPYTPEWSPSADAVSWESCLDHLFGIATRRHRNFDALDLSKWKNQVKLLITHQGQAASNLSRVRDMCEGHQSLTIEGRTDVIALVPKSGVSGVDFRSAVLSVLLQGLAAEKLTRAGTISLRLWIFPREEDLPGRVPNVRDPLNTVVVGGFTPEGLVLAGVQIDPQTLPTTPTPQPTVAPGALDAISGEPRYAPPVNPEEAEVSWGAVLPDHPSVNKEEGQIHNWSWEGRRYTLTWGFPTSTSSRNYLRILDQMQTRICSSQYGCYILNDPFLNSVHEVGEELLRLYGGKVTPRFAEFLLRFVQSMEYIPDPERETDWPRFPSEHLANRGGDCEDSSILLISLLAKFGFDSAFVSMPEHMAVGIAGPYSGYGFNHEGEKYYYAETAMGGGEQPIGFPDSERRPTEVLAPFFTQRLPQEPPVQILNFDWVQGQAHCLLSSQLPAGTQLQLTTQIRHTPDGFESRQQPELLASVMLPPQAEQSQIASVDFELDGTSTATSTHSHMDVVVWCGSEVVGRWFGIPCEIRG